MKKIYLIMAALMFGSMLSFTGCRPNPDPVGGEDKPDGPTKEGIYLGIIGFNENFTTKDIRLLNRESYGGFRDFINKLEKDNGTGLYYADYLALNKLDAYGAPPKLSNVALVTFTDGLDNVSLNEETNPENHSSTDAYCNSLSNRIKNQQIHGKKVNAYTIGIKGTDVYDDTEFRSNLVKLASDEDNVFEVSDMNEALERFSQIAESLYSETTTTSLKLQIPGGYNDGVKVRLTFDNVSSADNSQKYIECTYSWTGEGRSLENASYHGLVQGETTLYSVGKVGSYYQFEFKNLSYSDGTLIPQADISRLKLWRKIPSGAWQPDAEFTPDNSTQVTEEQSSALIMLVLDCSVSLGDQFANLKKGAINFIERLYLSSTGVPGIDSNGHEYVDLGLPSGLKWATCNVGAKNPEDYGNYYTWSETSTAAANWGGTWRRPAKSELEELVNKCTWKWTTQNGVNGYKVTGPNGDSIFLPAAGYRNGSSLYNVGSRGRYWSSTPYDSNYACYLYFDSSGQYMDYYLRSHGRSVRLVAE